MDAVFLKLLNMSVTAGWLILAVVVLRFALSKAPKWVRCALWVLVGLRLLLPFSVESALSLIPSAETVSPDILYSQTPAITSGIPALNRAVNPVISSALAPAAGASANPIQIWTAVSSRVWLAGIAAMLLYAAFSWLRMRRRVKASLNVRDHIYLCDDIQAPFILGVVRPRIYLPSGLSAETEAHVIAHELAHLKRRDQLWKPLGFLLLSVYWFHPLIWLAYILLCRDIELACDERVIRGMEKGDMLSYSEALYSCSAPRRLVMVCPLAFGEVGVKERIKAVLNYRKPAFWILAAAVAACAVVAVCFLTNPKTDDTPRKGDAQGSGVTLSLQDVIRLSDKGEALTWRDFDGYAYTDVGSGLYIRLYEIDARFSLMIGGGSTEEAPMYIHLVSKTNPDEYFDIRQGDVAAFIGARQADPYQYSFTVYMNPLSSYFPAGTTGYLYLKGTDSFSIVDEETGEVYAAVSPVAYDWTPMDNETWHALFTVGGAPDISGIHEPLMARLSEQYYLFDMDGGLWLGEYHGEKSGMWSVYELTPYASEKQPGAEAVPDTEADPLEAAVHAAILEHHRGKTGESDFRCESHVTLLTETTSLTQTTVYALVLYQEYSFSGVSFHDVSGSHTPTAITFTVSEGGEYALSEYWEPRDGSRYAPDIREKFPPSVAEDAMDTQKYILAQEQSCYAQAVAYGEVRTDEVIAQLLAEILSSPAESSNPSDYIEAHPIAYRELTFYGDYTLRYVFAEFLKGGQNDLRGHIMRQLIDDLAPESIMRLHTDTGQAYFDAWLRQAERMYEQEGEAYMKENAPKAFLLLQMAG